MFQWFYTRLAGGAPRATDVYAYTQHRVSPQNKLHILVILCGPSLRLCTRDAWIVSGKFSVDREALSGDSRRYRSQFIFSDH